METKAKHILYLYEYGRKIIRYKCDKCHEEEKKYYTDASTAAEFAYEDGWRATPNNVYCPKCAGKHLKNI